MAIWLTVMAVGCVVPSGNLNPPVVLSIVPATVRRWLGRSVPIPMLPAGSIRIRSTHELVPVGVVVNCRYVPCAVSVQFSAALNMT